MGGGVSLMQAALLGRKEVTAIIANHEAECLECWMIFTFLLFSVGSVSCADSCGPQRDWEVMGACCGDASGRSWLGGSSLLEASDAIASGSW